MIRKRYGYILLLLFLSFTRGLAQQTYPVQVNANLLPPYSLYLSDYYSSTREKLTVTLINRDQLKPVVSVRLRMIITAPGGIRIQSNDNAYIEPVTLETGSPMRLTQDDLAPYFQPNNLITQGYLGAGRLPEGMVEFCFQVIEAYTREVLSTSTCTRAWITSQKPPLLSLPRDKESIAFREPLNVLFQWTPLHQGLAQVEYDLILKELWDNGMTTQAAFPYSPEIYRETTRSTSLLYGAMQPSLLPGKRYAWTIRAKAREGLDEVNLFQNDGYSEIRSFTLQDNCLPPEYVEATAERKRLNLAWNTLPDYIGFTVSYRLKSAAGEKQAEWKEQQVQEPKATVYGLQNGGTYEYRVGGMCMAGQPVYSPVFTIVLPQADSARLAQCGIMPAVNLTNQEPLKELQTGTEIRVSDFPITITRIAGSNGRFTGEGWTIIPWLNDAKVAVEFTDISVNTDRQMTQGYVEAKYDKTEGQIANLDEVFEGGMDQGTVKTGLTRVDYKFDFSIPGVDAFALNDEGALVITDSEGTPHTVTAEDKEGQGNEGNKVVVFPMTVQDKEGNMYRVEKETATDPAGKVTETVKATALGKVGAPLAADSFDPTQLNGDRAIVTFNKGTGSYAFDTWVEYYDKVSLIEDKYQKLYDNYYAPWKFLPSGQSDKISATIEIKDQAIKPEKVIFKTPTGTEYKAVYANGTYTLEVASGPEGDVQELYALYPRDSSKFYTLGKIGIATYTPQLHKVVLVSVEGAVADARIEQKLIDIYGPVGITWEVTREQFSYKDNIRLMENSTGLSTYNDAMKALNAAYMAGSAYDKSANYLFFLKATGAKEINNRDASGFMPRGAQFGYIFTSEIPDAKEATTVAHELGHSRFKLRHTFDKEYGAVTGSDATDNLMDYNNGTHIAKWQWDIMNAPAMLVSVFEGDQASMARGGASDEQEMTRLIEEMRCGCMKSKEVKFLANQGMDDWFSVSDFKLMDGTVIQDLLVHLRGRDVPLASAYIKFNAAQSVTIEEYDKPGKDWILTFKESGPGVVTFYSDNKSDLEKLLKYLKSTTQAQWEQQMDTKIAEFEVERKKSDPDTELLKKIVFSIRCGFDRLKNADSRFFILQAISKEWRVDSFDETVANDIIHTTDQSQAVMLIDKLNTNTDVLMGLNESIHGDEYQEYYKELQALFSRAYDISKIKADQAETLSDYRVPILNVMGDYEFAEGLSKKGIILWSDPGLIRFIGSTDFSSIDYESVTIKDGFMSFHVDHVSMFGPDYDFDVKGTLKPFDAICVFVVTSSSDLFNPDAPDKDAVMRGSYFYLPAISMFMLDNIKTNNEIMRYVDAATIIVPAGLGVKAARWGFVGFETALYLAQSSVSDLTLEIAEKEHGKEFLRAWMVVNVLYAVVDMGGGLDDLKRAIQNLKGKLYKIPPSTKRNNAELQINKLEESLPDAVTPPKTSSLDDLIKEARAEFDSYGPEWKKENPFTKKEMFDPNSGGYVVAHTQHNNNFPHEYSMAEAFARDGWNLKLLSERAADGVATPDVEILGLGIFDFKNISAKTIVKNITKNTEDYILASKRQGGNIAFNLAEHPDVTKEMLNNAIRNAISTATAGGITSSLPNRVGVVYKDGTSKIIELSKFGNGNEF